MKTKTQSSLSGLPEEKFQLQIQRYLKICQQNVSSFDDARKWLLSNGLEDVSLFERLGIGWSQGDLPKKLPKDPAGQSEFVQSGLLDFKGTERLAGSSVFALQTPENRYQNVIGYASSTDVRFLPDRPLGLWNIRVVLNNREVFLVFDLVDALSLIAAGFHNVVWLHPSAGSIDVSELRRYGLERLVVVAGDGFTERGAVEALSAKVAGLQFEVVVLGNCAGTNEFLRKHGAKELAAAVVAGRKGIVSTEIPNFVPKSDGFSLRSDFREYAANGLIRLGHQIKLTLRVLCRGKIHVDTFDIYNSRQRKEFIREAARIFEEQPRLFEDDFARLIAACELRIAQPDLAPPDQKVDPVPEALRNEVGLFGKAPNLFQLLDEHLTALGIEGEMVNKLAAYLCLVSRLMLDPLSLIFKSGYGSGKNVLTNGMNILCPPESLFDVTHLSPKALLHVPANGLKHRFVNFEEFEVQGSGNYLIRTFISSGRLVARITARDPASGRLFMESKRVEGPAAVMATTSKPMSDEETLSRFIVLGLDESPEQTRRIQERQRRRQGVDAIGGENRIKKIIELHHAFQRMLQPLRVAFPDPDLIPKCDESLSGRRDLPKVISLIKTICFVRQMQKQVKQVDGVNYIEVDGEDLKIAAPLVRAIFRTALREISVPSRNLLILLHQMGTTGAGPLSSGTTSSPRFSFTMREAREFSNYSQTTLHRCKAELEVFEFLLRDTSIRGRPYRYFLDWVPEPEVGSVAQN